MGRGERGRRERSGEGREAKSPSRSNFPPPSLITAGGKKGATHSKLPLEDAAMLYVSCLVSRPSRKGLGK